MNHLKTTTAKYWRTFRTDECGQISANWMPLLIIILLLGFAAKEPELCQRIDRSFDNLTEFLANHVRQVKHAEKEIRSLDQNFNQPTYRGWN